MSRIHVITFVAASIMAVACSDVTGISMEYTAVTPEVVSLDVRVSGGLLVVELELSDPDTQLPDNVRIPVTVRSSSEDAETVLVRLDVCGRVSCSEYAIGIEQGDLGSLVPRLREYRAFILQELRNLPVVTAHFPYGTPAEILRTVGSWPGVRYVERLSVYRLADAELDAETPALLHIVRGMVRIETADVSPDNGFLEAESLDVLSVEYAPSTGPVLAKEVVLQ